MRFFSLDASSFVQVTHDPKSLTPRRLPKRSLLFLCYIPMKRLKSNLREVSAVYKKNLSVQNIKVASSQDVNAFIRTIYPVEINIREAMVAVFLNNSNHTLGYSVASIGGITGTLVDVRLILRDALLTQSTAIILVHNHPSGSLQPSQADISITEKVKNAALLMDIKLIDHLIITENQFFSFADEGKL